MSQYFAIDGFDLENYDGLTSDILVNELGFTYDADGDFYWKVCDITDEDPVNGLPDFIDKYLKNPHIMNPSQEQIGG